MVPDKEAKKLFKKEASKNPEKYYAVRVLKEEGFKRARCACGTYFWSVSEREGCGDPSCSGGFAFFKDNPARKDLDYVGVWREFSKMFKAKGYTPIQRYPVSARWRDDTDFVQASIYDFQPWVVSGEVEPPANPLVVPQFCLRFNDIDNVGVTMSHHTGFVMIGQHAFKKAEEWDQEKYFKDLLDWFVKGLGIPKEELVLHEDAWAGGGNLGPCMEFFCRGLELANQVYMLFEQSGEGFKDIPLRVLDMGMGHERVAWFVKGEGTMYDAAFPPVVKALLERTGVGYDSFFIQAYLPYASFLNLDEVEDLEGAWKRVADELGIKVEELKERVEPLAALYSVAEHARSLLFALADGALPGNVKGGYNLRVIYRRAQSFIDKHGWDLELGEVCEWHADYLKPLFPELSEQLGNVKKILEAEKEKYLETRERNEKLVVRVLKKGSLNAEALLTLYDSHGVTPEEVKEKAEKLGVKVEVPENFYSLVSELHERKEQRTQTRKEAVIDASKLPETKCLYYDSYDYVDFEGRALLVKDKYVVLDKTAFYPTSGGQEHDTGVLGGVRVVNVFKQGKVVVHELESKPGFKKGDLVAGRVDFERRLQLAQHHTATHIVGGVARKLLGSHVWQAGAAKTEEKSRLDITHYKNLSEQEAKWIEDEANKVVEENLPVYKSFMRRDLAERKYGFRIYQGGAVPGKVLRIVEIPGLDVQACGGTHLNFTSEAGSVKILRTVKVQDGVVRVEFVAGNAAKKILAEENALLLECSELLDCSEKELPARVEELFQNWKKAKKALRKGVKPGKELLRLKADELYEGDVVKKLSEILRTPPEHVLKTVKRFKEELERMINS